MNLFKAAPLRTNRDVLRRAAFRALWCAIGAVLYVGIETLRTGFSPPRAIATGGVWAAIVLVGAAFDTLRVPAP